MTSQNTTETIKTAVSEAIKCLDTPEKKGTQKMLAERARISQGAVGKYLRGEARPTGQTAKRLESAVSFRISKSRFAPHIFDED